VAGGLTGDVVGTGAVTFVVAVGYFLTPNTVVFDFPPFLKAPLLLPAYSASIAFFILFSFYFTTN